MNNDYHLNDTQKKIYDYVIKSLEKNHKPTITQVSDATFVSTTYIVKMSKQLGYAGYSDFLHVTNWLMRNDKTSDEDLVIRFDSDQRNGIKMVARLIKNHSHSKIFVVGTGYSNIVSSFVSKRLCEVGIFCYSGSPFDMKVPLNDCLVIFVSRSGETEDLFSISRKLGNTVSTLLITSNSDSTISKDVDQTHIIPDEQHGQSIPIPNLFVGKSISFFEMVYQELRIISSV